MPLVSFFIPGKCESKGSVKAFPYIKAWMGKNPSLGVHSVATNAKRLKAFEEAIQLVARHKWRHPPVSRGVIILIQFRIRRPASHHTKTGKKTKAWTPYPTGHQMGDIDKLSRAVIDGIQGSIITDDKYVTELHASKRFALKGEDEGVHITIIIPQEVYNVM